MCGAINIPEVAKSLLKVITAASSIRDVELEFRSCAVERVALYQSDEGAVKSRGRE